MDDVEFRIVVHCPVALTVDSAKNVVTAVKPKWRILQLELNRLEPNVWECKLRIHPDDVRQDDHDSQIRLRDAFLSLLALYALVPVRPLMKGTFTFPLGNGKYAQKSLGPMDYTFPEKPVLSLAPLVEGLGLDDAYLTACWFLWQAMNSSEPVHRFLNLAVACELVVGKDSPVEGSRAPTCPTCNQEISCPHCGKEIRIPTTLRERAAFLINDATLLPEFIDLRNRVFHGGLSDLQREARAELIRVNTKLLVVMRNYLGERMSLQPLKTSDVGEAVNTPEIFVTVFYESPKPTAPRK